MYNGVSTQHNNTAQNTEHINTFGRRRRRLALGWSGIASRFMGVLFPNEYRIDDPNKILPRTACRAHFGLSRQTHALNLIYGLRSKRLVSKPKIVL